MQLRLLGPLELWADGEWTRLDAARQRGVLALLAVRAGALVPRDWLIDELWGGVPPRSARTTLQSCVYRVRRRIEGSGLRIHSSPDGYLLEVPEGESDLAEYERLVGAGRAALEDGRVAVGVARLRDALALWSGEFLGDVDLPAVRERARELEEDRLGVLETCLAGELELGRHGQVVPDLLALTAQHPLRELLWQLLMTAQCGAGRRAEALETYQRLWRVLDEQLGVQPSAATQELQARILESSDADLSAPPEPRGRVAGPRQLPASIPGFTGRDAELKQLDEYLDRFEGEPAAGLCVITGPAGIGKTTTAVHWARLVAERFADGQLYADLHGFDPSGRAADPGTTLAGFLTALGTPPERIPPDPEARTAAFRSLLDDRRVLVVLDNARSAEQVRPLLAGGPGCLTVVTSRDRLAGLVVTEQAAAVTLEPLDADAARLLLEARVGAERVGGELTAVRELISGCAGLPLALTVVGALAGLHPDWPLASLAADLRPNALDALSAGDPEIDARAVFSWSYRLLTPPAARLFRLLGVHPGPGFGADACAALAGLPAAEVQPLLDELCGSHQLTQTAPGRYAMHDLLRSYAAELAGAEEAREARHRLLDLMVHTACAAALTLIPTLDPIALDPPRPLVVVDPPATAEAAKAWFVLEQETLVGLTHADGADLAVWPLSWALSGFLDRQGAWHDWLGVAERGLAAADRARSMPDRVVANLLLGRVLYRLGRFDETLAAELRSLELSRAAGDVTGEAKGYVALGAVQARLGQVGEAIDSAAKARDRYADLGNRSGHANALNNIGWYHVLLGEHEEAVRYCRMALDELREIGEQAGESDTLHSLGVAYLRLGRHDEALDCFQRSIELHEQLGRKYKLALALDSAGDVHELQGDHGAALARWRHALDLFEELEHPRAAAVRAKLA